MDAIFEKDQQMWRKIIDWAIATGEIRNDIATEEAVDMFRMAHLGMLCWLLPRDLILND
jgi:hypothetical protein